MSFSTGKSITSSLVGMAIEDGFIESVDEPLTAYLPGLIGSAYEDVSIKEALQMSSGVAWDEGYDFSDLEAPLAYHMENAMVQQRYRIVEAANSLTRAHPPGSKYNYNTLETCILGWLVETATKQRLAGYMEQRFWQPAGMEFDASWMLDGPEDIGREMAGGLLAASLRDYGRFALMMLNGGKAGNQQILSQAWVREAVSVNSEAVAYGNLYDGYPLGYGYQWWLFPKGDFEAQGVFGQFIYVSPEEELVIVKLSGWEEAWINDLEQETYAFIDAVKQALAD